jgi:hypothetical protein
MSYLNLFSHAAIVKSYTKLMLISEPKLAQLMAKISLSPEINTLEGVVQAIEKWYTSGFPTTTISVLENLENELTVADIDEDDTSDKLIKEFFGAVQRNKPQ